ncbi:MAG: bifunctional 5,10-methylenetetrahydrofolate dehydrogenase/5,10-methenyltetrahydrofolate cyclohydrolase [Acidobacteriota bacterium]|jgi:methylenetetrahydrofolate dehydrogenase (NADP+)/methenyltetrahydrofolate cyclohydrolase
MSATLLLGKPVQEAILEDVKAGLAEHTGAGHRAPKLAAVLVGDDPASAIYVRTKTRKCEELGIDSEAILLPESTATEELLARVDALNADDGVDGILVQLPLPSGVDTEAVLDRIDPRKDVDGLHPENVGLLVQKRPRFVPATPGGIMQMLDRAGIQIEGQNAVIIGRSEIVGKPMASLLMHRNATITVCHSRTRDLPAVCRGADILIIAIGRDAMVTREFVKPGATVIDVGINRVGDRDRVEELFGDAVDWDRFDERGYLVVGDVHPEVAELAGAMTPVPGGVGPLTIGMLMANTLLAARLRAGLSG